MNKTKTHTKGHGRQPVIVGGQIVAWEEIGQEPPEVTQRQVVDAANASQQSTKRDYAENRAVESRTSDTPMGRLVLNREILRDEVKALTAQRDELLAALKLLVQESDDPFFKGAPSASAKAQADAAIAKAERK